MPEFAGFVYTAAGAGNSGLAVNLYARNGTSSAVAETTTNSDGAWTISHGTEGRFDVEIVVDASNKFRIKYDDKIQCELGEFGQLYLRGTNDAFTTKLVSTPTASRTITFPDADATALLGGYANTNSGVMSFTSTANSAAAVYLRENGGTSGTIKIHADQGTSVTEGAESINILSDVGGVGIRSTANLAKAINITSDGGTTGSIAIFNDQGTSVTEGAESISILSDAGGIGIRSTANLANAVNVTVDGGTTSTMTLFNDQGTAATEGAASIQLLSDVGGINIKSGLNAADAILLTADGGTSEKIRIHADQGTGVDSIELISDAGGIELNVASGVGITGNAIKDEDGMDSNSAVHIATQQSIKAYVDAQIATEDTLAELNDTNISGAAAGHLLIYDNTASVWDNVALTADDGITATAGDGTLELDLDLKSNGGAVIESNELAVDLGASSITGTLAVGDGGTGATTLTSNAILTGNSTSAIQAEADLTFSSNKVIPTASAHNAAGTALTISAGATTAGTTDNIAGGALTFQGGQGKGSGAGGDIIFQTANAGGSGSSLNSLATALTLSDDLSAAFAGAVTVTGNLTVNGTTTTVDTTNTTVKDSLIELNNGVASGSNSNDSGLLIERGSTGNNAIFMWDESADVFTVGTTTSTAASTGNLANFTAAPFTAAAIVGTTIDADTDFTIGDTVITDGVVTDSTGLQLAANMDINGTVDISGALTLGTVAAAGTDTDKFLVLDGSGNVDYRTGTQVLSDIGAAGSKTYGISDDNAVEIDGADIADNEYARFTANGLESRTAAEVAADIEGSIDAVGALDAGSITSNFGTINTGSSTITTTGSLQIQTIDYTDGDLAMTIADGGGVTFAQASTFTGGLTLNGDANLAAEKLIKIGGTAEAHDFSTEHSGHGITLTMEAGENLTLGQAVYVDSNGKAQHPDVDAATVTGKPAIGIAMTGASSGASVNVMVLGMFRDATYNFTPGAAVIMTGTDGALTTTAGDTAADGDIVQRVGIAITADMLFVMPSIDEIEHA